MNILFLVSMIVEAIFAVGLLFIPATLMGLNGITLDTTSTYIARMFGSALLAFPFLLWFARRSSAREFKRATVITMFVYYLVSGILLLMAELNKLMNPMGWGLVGLHLVFIIWFGYYLLKRA